MLMNVIHNAKMVNFLNQYKHYVVILVKIVIQHVASVMKLLLSAQPVVELYIYIITYVQAHVLLKLIKNLDYSYLVEMVEEMEGTLVNHVMLLVMNVLEILKINVSNVQDHIILPVIINVYKHVHKEHGKKLLKMEIYVNLVEINVVYAKIIQDVILVIMNSFSIIKNANNNVLLVLILLRLPILLMIYAETIVINAMQHVVHVMVLTQITVYHVIMNYIFKLLQVLAYLIVKIININLMQQMEIVETYVRIVIKIVVLVLGLVM